MNLILLLAYASTMLFLSRKSNQNLIGSNFLIIAWWMGWVTISTVVRPGYFFPDASVVYIVIVFCFSILLGESIAKRQKNLIFASLNESAFDRVSKITTLALVPFVLLSFYVFFITFKLVYLKGLLLTDLRTQFFIFPPEGNYWFKNKTLWSLFLISSGTVFHFLLVVSIPFAVNCKKYILLYIFTVLVLIESFSRMSRGLIYSIIFAFSFTIFQRRFLKKIVISKKFIYGLISLVLIIALLTIYRKQNIFIGLIQYHTIGFSLFSKLISMDFYYNNSNYEWGRMSLGGFDYFFTLIWRYLGDKSFQSPAYFHSILENSSIPLGPVLKDASNFLEITVYNSFYTLLSSPYLDFGLVGVLMIGALVGFFNSQLELAFKKNKSTMALIWLLFIFYNCFMGIFGAALELPSFWATLILLFLLQSYVTRYTAKLD